MEVTLLRPLGQARWKVLARPLKRLRAGDALEFGSLEATVQSVAEGAAVLQFDRSGKAFRDALDEAGEMPLPPYIARRRAVDRLDREQYQTVFADRAGAVAAPTAGLHFDAPLLDALDARGIRRVRVTLHVGGGTFLPIRPGAESDSAPEAEWGSVSAAAAAEIAAARAEGRRVVAVGTTSLRLLETVAAENAAFGAWEGETSLFVRPGHQFRAVDVLFTNFHLPHSSLLVLVSAFLGVERCRSLYRHALENGYRFYSYGDASLLFR